MLLRWGVVNNSPNPQARGPTLVGCPRLLIQYIRSHFPYRRPFHHLQPEDAPCLCDMDQLIVAPPKANEYMYVSLGKLSRIRSPFANTQLGHSIPWPSFSLRCYRAHLHTHGTSRCATTTMKHVDCSVTRFGDLNLCTVWSNTADVSSECWHLRSCFSKMVPQRTQYVNQLTDWMFSRFGETAWWKLPP